MGWLFENLNSVVPAQRLFETSTLLAFYHPKPSYPLHILIVPKKSIAKLVDLDVNDDQFSKEFLGDVVECVKVLVEKLGIGEQGYRLIVNGGAYQEIPIVHFHLVSEKSKLNFSN